VRSWDLWSISQEDTNDQATGLIVPIWIYLSSWIYFTTAISEVTVWEDYLSSSVTIQLTVLSTQKLL